MLFGNSAPKFIFDPDGENITVLLDYIVTLEDRPEEDYLIHESVFTKHRSFILKGKNWIYRCKLHLYKYTGVTPQVKYAELKQYEGSAVRFYRHRDGDYLKDSTGAEVQMFLQSVDESYYQTSDYKDLLLLKFISTEYVDLTQGIGI